VAANSAIQVSLSVSALVGPPLAGVVAGLTGQPAAALAMDAGVLLLRTSALLLFSFNVMLGGTLGQLVVFGRVVPGLGSLPLSLLYSAEGVARSSRLFWRPSSGGGGRWAGLSWPRCRCPLWRCWS
jgi:hypothetical protein